MATTITTTLATTPPPAKSSFLAGFWATAKTDASKVASSVEAAVTYTADTALANIKTELTKIDTFVAAKVASIEAHNQHILSLQNLIKDEQSLVNAATALKTKITSVL